MKIPPYLGRYEVVDLIGQGGMGALYRARDPRIGRYVAIKLLRPGYDTPELRDRFSREARAAGSLSHPNIVTIYDVGEHDGLPFIAMEYVRGETFADLVCLRPPLSVLRKVQLTEEVCAGLAHAHEAGIVHRDIKPANLIVGPEGTVKILDFGIAKLTATGITVAGSIMGTLNYMSPEQVQGTSVDPRADIFSVGAVLYELLSHQQAFPGQIPGEVLQRILNGVPNPLTEYCPDIDPRLVELVDRALEKDPNRRFQSVAAVQKELASIRLNPQPAVMASTPAPTPTPARKTPSPAKRDLAAIRAQHIDEHLAAAQDAFDSGDFDAAIESCKEVLMLNASEDRAVSLIDRIHAAIDEQQTAIRAAIERAREEFEAGNPASALRAVEQVLALEPDNAEAQALGAAAAAAVREIEEQARLQTAVDEARRRFADGEHQAALQSLEALEATSNALVIGTLDELRLALREIEERRRVEYERRRRITTLVADALAALKENRFDEVAQALERVREIDAAAPELPDLTERLQRAQAAARLNEDVERTLADFDEQLTQGELPRAADVLEAAAALAPADSRVHSARQRLEQATAALAAREAAEARRREGEQKIDDAAARLETGDLAGAAAMLKLAAELVPQHPRAAELSEQLREALARQAAAEAAERLRRQIEELMRSASERLQSTGDNAGDLATALRDVNQVLALDPGHAEAPALKTAIEELIAARREAARVRAAINNARRRFANGKHQAALRLLEDYQPAHPEIAAALNELRGTLLEIEEQRRVEQERLERQQRLAALLVEARTALRDQRFDEALGLLSTAAEIDAAAAEISSLREQVRQEQDAARRRAELDRTLADLDENVARGELSAAGDLLSLATALNPNDARVQAARQRIDQAVAAREAAEARTRDLEAKNAAAERLFAHGDLQGAMQLLTLAAALNPQHPETVLLTERVTDAIAQREAADAVERQRQTIDELLAAATEYLQSPDHKAHDATLAFGKITQVLSLDPGHAGALALKATAVAALVAQREAAFIGAAIRNARSRFANGKHQAALQLLENLDASAHPIVAETLKELRGALQEIEERRRAEQQSTDDGTAAHDATRLIIPGRGADPNQRSAGEVGVPSITPAAGLENGDGKPAVDRTTARIQPADAAARAWPWGLIVVVVLFLLAILAALLLLSRPASARAPQETAGTDVSARSPSSAGATTRPFA